VEAAGEGRACTPLELLFVVLRPTVKVIVASKMRLHLGVC